MRIFTLVLLLFSFNLFAKDKQPVEEFFMTYLTDLRQKEFDKTKEKLSKTYFENLGGDEGLKKLISMQDGKKEKPKVKLKIEKGVDEIYFVEIRDFFTKHNHYRYVIIKENGKLKINGTQSFEDK